MTSEPLVEESVRKSSKNDCSFESKVDKSQFSLMLRMLVAKICQSVDELVPPPSDEYGEAVVQ